MDISGFFDTIYGGALYGWAFDADRPNAPVRVEAVLGDGRVLATAQADIFRGDLLTAGYGTGRCSFKLELPDYTSLIDHPVMVRVVGTQIVLAGSPRQISLNRTLLQLLRRPERARRVGLRRLTARLDRNTEGGVSIIMPIHDTPRAWLLEALESVRAQWCSRWELLCVDDASSKPDVAAILTAYAKADPRIRLIRHPVNAGIAAASNSGIQAARYGHVAFLDHDDVLEPHAVFRLLRAIAKTDADLLYSDEVLTGPDSKHFLQARLRPAFSHDYYMSHPYFVHLVCVRTALARRIHGWDEQVWISADVDFVLRVLAETDRVAHIPSILYRWRTHTGSAGHAAQAEVMVATTRAIQQHLSFVARRARVAPAAEFNQFVVTWPAAAGRTLIIVPTKNAVDLLRACVKSIERTVDPQRYRLLVIDHESDEPRAVRYLNRLAKRHNVMRYSGVFNFARMNNLAAKSYGHGCKFLLFLNNDVECIEAGWLERMTSLAVRSDIGVVGAALLFGDQRYQHAGVIIGYEGAAEHVGKFLPFKDATGARTLGPNCMLTSVRDFSAVTGACLLMRRQVFVDVGGFDEAFPVAFNDTDLCLRVRAAGYRVLYDGQTVLYHHESATRTHTNDLVHPEDTDMFKQRWRHLMNGRDPFYHPALALSVQDHILREGTPHNVAEPRMAAL